jgi:hypothetical protein
VLLQQLLNCDTACIEANAAVVQHESSRPSAALASGFLLLTCPIFNPLTNMLLLAPAHRRQVRIVPISVLADTMMASRASLLPCVQQCG